MTATIVYVSSNRESLEFENKIKADLLEKCGNVPIISVTQKPIDLGKNICVGDIGASGFNFCRQILIGCKEATTDFIISAEADCLYSPDYFTFRPRRLDICYRNTNIYILKYKRDYFNKKSKSTFSQIIGREYYIKRLEELFKNQQEWNTKLKNFPKEIGKKLFNKFKYFETEFPCISFKTGRGMRQHTTTFEEEYSEIPFWGNAVEFRKKYLD